MVLCTNIHTFNLFSNFFTFFEWIILRIIFGVFSKGYQKLIKRLNLLPHTRLLNRLSYNNLIKTAILFTYI
jgi:hypothetical protein